RPRPLDAGHILRGGALPLCAVARRGVRDLRGLVLLVPEDDRLHVLVADRPYPLLGHLHRRESGFLPAALPRPCWHAAPLHRLSGRVRRLEPCVVDRLVHLRGRRPDLPLWRVRSLLEEAYRGRQSVGRGCDDAGMAAAFAAALPPVGAAAEDP